MSKNRIILLPEISVNSMISWLCLCVINTEILVDMIKYYFCLRYLIFGTVLHICELWLLKWVFEMNSPPKAEFFYIFSHYFIKFPLFSHQNRAPLAQKKNVVDAYVFDVSLRFQNLRLRVMLSWCLFSDQIWGSVMLIKKVMFIKNISIGSIIL